MITESRDQSPSYNDIPAISSPRTGFDDVEAKLSSNEEALPAEMKSGGIAGSVTHVNSSVCFDNGRNQISTVYMEMDDKNPTYPNINQIGSGETMASVMTADGIADPISFRINCFAIFAGDMARGIFFPTMWNLVQMIGGDQVLLGYVTSSFSFGRMLVLPLFGKLSTTYGCKKVLLFASSIFFVGTLMFTQVLNIERPWFLILSNAMLGIGSGTLAVTRSYTSDVTPTRNRTSYMALISAIQYSGTTVTPFLGSLFIVMFANEDGDAEKKFFTVNEYTAPALFMAVTTASLFYLLHKYFEDVHQIRNNDTHTKKILSARRRAYQDLHDAPVCCGRMTKHTLCLITCMFLNIFVKGPMSCFETMGVEFANSKFNMPREDAGVIVALAGFLGAVNLMILRISITQYYNDIQILVIGYSMFIIGILVNSFLDLEDPHNNPKWMYTLSMIFIYSVGYPVCHVALIGYFSKVVGRRPQGTMMGLFAASGSFARVFFPVLSGYAVVYKDIGTLFYLLAAFVGLSLGIVFMFRHTLISLSE